MVMRKIKVKNQIKLAYCMMKKIKKVKSFRGSILFICCVDCSLVVREFQQPCPAPKYSSLLPAPASGPGLNIQGKPHTGTVSSRVLDPD
jgi:hypothetical protein